VKSTVPALSVIRPYRAQTIRTELLPFQVRLVNSAQDLAKAVEIRASAYTRHLPHYGGRLREPEAEDYRRDVLVLIAERKLDGAAVGTMRLEPNFVQPLGVESEIRIPSGYGQKRLLETTRLGIQNGQAGTMVMVALVKAAFEICHACSVDYGLAVGRRSMAEVFGSMCYDMVVGPVQMSFAKVPFWLFAIPIAEVEDRLQLRGHSYFDFMARTSHPDLQVDYEQVFEAFGKE